MKKIILLITLSISILFNGCGGSSSDDEPFSWGINLDYYEFKFNDLNEEYDFFSTQDDRWSVRISDEVINVDPHQTYYGEEYYGIDGNPSHTVEDLGNNVRQITTTDTKLDVKDIYILTPTSNDAGKYNYKSYYAKSLMREKDGTYEIYTNGKVTDQYKEKYLTTEPVTSSSSSTSTSSSDYSGEYIGNATDYTDTLNLYSDGTGKRKHVSNYNSTYDYNVAITWEYSGKKIVTTWVESFYPAGAVGDKNYYSITNSNLTLDGGVGIVFYKN